MKGRGRMTRSDIPSKSITEDDLFEAAFGKQIYQYTVIQKIGKITITMDVGVARRVGVMRFAPSGIFPLTLCKHLREYTPENLADIKN